MTNKTLLDYKLEITPETENKQKNDFRKVHTNEALYIGIICFIFSIIIIIANQYAFSIQLLLFSILGRILAIVAITYYSNKLNRIPLPWQIFALFMPCFSLIAIGLSKKNDNNFYDFKNAANKEDFFKSLTNTDKLKLYKHILTRASISPYWLDTISSFNVILFENESSALLALQEYENLYKKNLLLELKEKMPTSLHDKELFFKPLVNVGLINSSFYTVQDNGSLS